MNLLEVKNLCKSYPSFKLEDVSFSLPKGYIMGFIGKNGAGKSTAIKCIYNLIKKDKGDIYLLGRKLEDISELELKQEVALMLGGMDIYPTSKIGEIGEVVSSFYKNFDNETYNRLLKKFELDKNKKFKELSNGMKSKFLLTLAMSHKAKLLILDEPTSGLDPYSRDQLLEEFQNYIQDGERSILFSTQIVSDLESIADYIGYIKEGKIIDFATKDDFVSSYKIFSTKKEIGEHIDPSILVGIRESSVSFEGLIRSKDASKLPEGIELSEPSIEEIMIFNERGK
ncbi:MAG: ABC transporter ATP-binding protein [Bacillales bacterium]|nr:ABC transporter ATP-binding protein [Mollicutes bacterium]MCI7213564.1 ABC transporter ATP-binding protein [Bacillales bacterium]MDY3904008.1 ABC transporter ATP-binding protein [Candidatus Enteromonas sp.]MCI7058793.1 ABC transporter ATP-binding protein [Mollicutes bacterium]MDD7715163.1 ABC transporter ATP-binding protein [Mollicutes bacterium]